MSATTIAAPEAAFAALREVGEELVHRMSIKYSKDRNSPYTSPEDFEQEVWTRLWEWIGKDDHLDQADGLLEDHTECKRFLTQFCRARICDTIDIALAGPRDQRLTITASLSMSALPHISEGGGGNNVTLLEMLAHQNGFCDSGVGSEIEALESIRSAIGPDRDSLRIFDALLNQPESVREAFCESRLRLCRGLATLTEADSVRGDSMLCLSVQEGYILEDQEVTWTGKLPSYATITTSMGEAKVSTPERASTVLRWTETKLIVRLDRLSHEGEFMREVVRPSPKVFDMRVMQDHLGISGLRTREAWLRLQSVLRTFLGAA